MNYQLIYDSLIEKRSSARLNRTDGAVERHHITPRSWGGSDEDSNLIFLTRREHFLAHLLLVHLADSVEKRLKMLYAVKRMSPWKKTSRAYQRVQELWQAERSLHMNEIIGENGESRRQLTTRRSAKTMAETVMNGKTLQEVRFEKISKNHKEIHEWEHLDGRTFTGTAFELSRSHRGELIEPSKMMKFLNTPTRHRGWRSKIGSQSKSHVEKRYTEIYFWVHESGLDFVGTSYELHKQVSTLYPNKLQKAALSGRSFGGWRAKELSNSKFLT